LATGDPAGTASGTASPAATANAAQPTTVSVGPYSLTTTVPGAAASQSRTSAPASASVPGLLLNECRLTWMRRWVQTLSYMPHFLSWVIIFGITGAFLSESTGLVNRWLEQLTGHTVGFLTSTDWFRSVLVGTEVWKDMGWGAIIYLAAMVGIDPSRYEVARVDGANRLRQIWHITLPGIRNVIILLLVLRLGHVLEAGFEQVYIFYNLQVYPVADILDTWVFRTGLENLNFSLAAAAGLFKSIIGLVLILAANRIAKRWDGQLW